MRPILQHLPTLGLVAKVLVIPVLVFLADAVIRRIAGVGNVTGAGLCVTLFLADVGILMDSSMFETHMISPLRQVFKVVIGVLLCSNFLWSAVSLAFEKHLAGYNAKVFALLHSAELPSYLEEQSFPFWRFGLSWFVAIVLFGTHMLIFLWPV